MLKIIFLLAIGLLGCGARADYPDYSLADEAFSLRGQGLEQVNRARLLYEEFLPRVTSLELIHAVEHNAKLAYFGGELLLAPELANRPMREEIFSRCLKNLEYIKPDIFSQELEVYTYWQSACTFYRAKALGTGFDENRARMLSDTLPALEAFYDGGFYRLAAEIYLWLARHDHQENYVAAAQSLLDHAEILGPDYWQVYLLRAQALMLRGHVRTAGLYLDQIIPKLKLVNIPPELIPENEIYLSRLLELSAAVVNQISL